MQKYFVLTPPPLLPSQRSRNPLTDDVKYAWKLTALTLFSWWNRYSKRACKRQRDSDSKVLVFLLTLARAGRWEYLLMFSLETSTKGPPGSVSIEAYGREIQYVYVQ